MFEYVEGETLKERIRRLGRLPIAEAVAYAIEIARALGAAHARHIVHRDVKPQNVLIDEEGSAKVTDFGIARTLDEEGLTADGRVLGTTDYVSPEQALGQHVTGQSDLYSLGIVLYEMLTGEVPFKGDSQVAVAMKHVREQIPDVQPKRPEVSAALAAVVDDATAKRQEDRYADDAELIADLEDVLAIETAARRQRHRRSDQRVAHAAVDVRSGGFPSPSATVWSRWWPADRRGGDSRRARCGWRRGPTTAPASSRRRRRRRLAEAAQQVQLCQTCAYGFNPLGDPTDEAPNAAWRSTATRARTGQTQDYYDEHATRPRPASASTSTPSRHTTARIAPDLHRDAGVEGDRSTPPTPAAAHGPNARAGVEHCARDGRRPATQSTSQAGQTSYRYCSSGSPRSAAPAPLQLNEVALYERGWALG